jgi:hypothetical protein
LGHAVAGIRSQGSQLRPRRDERTQHRFLPLALLAGRGEPLRGAVHQLLRKRDSAHGKKPPVWFAFNESRPLAFFAGIWTPQWKSVRKVKEGETTNDLYAFLTTEPNAEVGAIHPKAMPVILTTQEDIDHWMTAPAAEALKIQRPLVDGA